MPEEVHGHDLYRIGVVGPEGSGKSLLLSGFNKAANISCPICCHAEQSAPDPNVSLSDDSLNESTHHPCDVFSVVVKEKGPLGIKIAKHKKYNGFVCVKGFVRDANTGDKYELERSGKVCPGDLLVAVNRQNFLNMPQQDITNILRKDNEIRVLTFLRASEPGTDAASVDASASALGIDVSATGAGGHCTCSTWRTFASCGGRTCCIELVEIPGSGTSLSLLRSHISGLDGIVFVYSLEATSSLLTLEKRYARALPGMLPGKSSPGGMEGFPLVVVATSHCSSPVPASPVGGLNERPVLLAEGNAFADVWGAPAVLEAALGAHVMGEDGVPKHLTQIFERVLQRVDAVDDPSAFVMGATGGLGLSYYLPMCFGDCTDNSADSGVDTSIAGDPHTAVETNKGSVPYISRRRLTTRKLRPYLGFEDAASPRTVVTHFPAHPSEESPFGSSSTKILKYLLSSCE